MSAVYIDGRDATDVLNEVKTASPQATHDRTTFRSPGFARRYLAGLETDTLSCLGFLPFDKATADIMLKGRVGPERSGQLVTVGVGGFDPGNLMLHGKSLKTNQGTQIMSDGLVSASADFQYTTGSPGLVAGVTGFTSHGTAAFSAQAVQSLTFDEVPAKRWLAIRKAGGSTLSAPFHASDGISTIRARIESIYGGSVSVTGELTTSTTPTETLYSGVLTVTFITPGAVPLIEVISGEVQEATISGAFSSGIWEGAPVANGDTSATVESLLRGRGGDYSAVLVTGSSS